MRKCLDRFQYPGKLLEGGEVLPNSPRNVKGHLAFYEPCEVIVHVERRKKRRSREQQGYYWAVVLPEIALHTGHSVEELHDIFKSKYLSRRLRWRGGFMLTVRSTSDLTTNEFAEYLTNVILEAGELGVEVPPADKAYQFKS